MLGGEGGGGVVGILKKEDSGGFPLTRNRSEDCPQAAANHMTKT